ncbi:MAG: tetratricopeptide repeat protein [Rhodospirillaceae bacterium]|jgi:tetratricopeptide (TPR) repeat protein|nr:tetratricopeptide repeat protein [Rhodospirillaceae bacterium]
MNRSRRRKQKKLTKANLAHALEHAELAMTARNWSVAIDAYHQILRIDNKNGTAWANLGGAYIETGAVGKAEEALQRANAITPGSIPILGNLANLKKQLGDVQAAEQYYRKILLSEPGSARAWHELAQVKRFKAGDPDIETMQSLYETGTRDDEARMHLGFALGKALEDSAEFDVAFPYLADANRLKRQTLKFDIKAHQSAIEDLIRVFDVNFLAQRGSVGNADERPIFVLGMPRSGTTLVEQILASHNAVFGAGELEDLSQIIAGSIPGFPSGTGMLPAAAFDSIGRQYVDRLSQNASSAKRVTDKMPRNFLFIGLIALILPNARIVHCRRSPMDTCLSCFTLHFPHGQEFSYDLAELGAYYRLYRGLMEHWHRVLPGKILDIAYEDVVADTEGKARQLVDFCGLEWDDACLNFHQTKRQVMTASATQVREPVHARSVARWRRYERFLSPLRDALGPYADEGA